MLKVTDKLKEQHSGDAKGRLYLFLIAANQIALSNTYDNFTVDPGVKPMEFFVNAKIESIYNPTTGPFFRDDYQGYDEIRSKAIEASQDIVAERYTPAVIDFIQTAISSHVPKALFLGQAEVLSPKRILKVAKANVEMTGVKDKFVDEGVSAKVKQKVEKEEADFSDLERMAASLDDDDDNDLEFEGEEFDESNLEGLENAANEL